MCMVETDAATPSSLRIAMALYGDVSFDSRVQREAASLAAAGHAVTIYCLAGELIGGEAERAGVRVVAHTPSVSRVLPGSGAGSPVTAGRWSSVRRRVQGLRWFLGYVRNLRAWGRWAVKAAGDVDVWHAHDMTGLMAVGPQIDSTCHLVYDSHEIYLAAGSASRLPSPIKRILAAYEGRLARRAEALVTVNEGLERYLSDRLHPRRVIVVRNCPSRWTPRAEDHDRLRRRSGVPTGSPIVLYHGRFSRQRGIEELLEAVRDPVLSTVHVVLLGYGDFQAELEHIANDPIFDGRVHVLDAVPPDELLGWVAGADVGAVAVQRSSLNHWLSSPNKLWESIAAGVPVVVSDFPVMRAVVRDDPNGPLGAVCDPADASSFSAAIAAIVNAADDDRAGLRARCRKAAHERWNWEQEVARLVEFYSTVDGHSSK